MKVVTMYEAEDGKQFRYEDQCLRHEEECANLKAANELLNSGATLMQALERFHMTHKWWDSGLTDEDKAVLSRMTKDTGLRVRHWQCSDVAGYKPCELDLGGRVYLWGDAGCWSGPYGGWAQLDCLLRYAHETFQEHA